MWDDETPRERRTARRYSWLLLATGLGLASMYGIVRESRGYISLESELGTGTTSISCCQLFRKTRQWSSGYAARKNAAGLL